MKLISLLIFALFMISANAAEAGHHSYKNSYAKHKGAWGKYGGGKNYQRKYSNHKYNNYKYNNHKRGIHPGYGKKQRYRDGGAFIGGVIAGSLGTYLLNQRNYSRSYNNYHKPNIRTYFSRDDYGTCYKNTYRRHGWVAEKVPAYCCE